MQAILLLEDGSFYLGKSFGIAGETCAEIVFNTSMTGYQEIITDPSYCGQFVVMTYPLIGNYGINSYDNEASKPFLSGLVVKEASKVYSNHLAEMSLQDFMLFHKILGIEDVDTRAITKKIRDFGAMRAILSTLDFDPKSLLSKLHLSPNMEGLDLVKQVMKDEKLSFKTKNSKYNIALIDCGVKTNIIRELNKLACNVTVYPAITNADTILAENFDGIMLSNGPGDPSAVEYTIENIQKLLGKIPIFGICLGHQIIALALGYKTYKMKFGHHGANHPVKDFTTGKIEITSQNHGFAVDACSIGPDCEITHLNLNDNTVEGFSHKNLPVFSVQYHPESSPGPFDAKHLFQRFIDLVEQNKSCHK